MKHLFFLSFLFFQSWALAKNTDEYRIYVATFQYSNSAYSALASQIADDFQKVLSNCGGRFKVLDRAHYVSWIEEANNQLVDETKQLLYLQDVDYIVFGEVVYNGTKDFYTIEYGFEEVNTGSILVLDNLVFYAESDMMDDVRRFSKIQTRIADEFDLCKGSKEETVQRMVQVKEKVTHRFRDKDRDGVPDLIDLDNNTPPGVMVNGRGVAFSAATTAAINDPAARDSIESAQMDGQMAAILKEMLPSLPVLTFLPNTTTIEEEFYTQLHQVAKIMEMYPAMFVSVVANTNGTKPRMAYLRAEKTIDYLLYNYDLQENRFILRYEPLKDLPENSVKFEVVLEARRSMSPPE